MKRFKRNANLFASAVFCASIASLTLPAQAWEPTKAIEIIVPAGTGGGADQMARAVQGIITKHNLSKQSVVVLNKAGGAGAKDSSTSRIRRATRTSSSSRFRTCSRRRSPPEFPFPTRT